MTDDSMPVPHWVDTVREQMFDAHKNLDYDGAKIKRRELPVVEDFSNLFAEYELRDHDLLVHVFPRAGGDDRYWPCEYKKDGTYVPSRLEDTVDGPSFPNDIVNRIKAAVDEVWQGDVAIDRATLLRYDSEEEVVDGDPVEADIKAYAVQFQSAATSAKLVGIPKFVDQFCEALDKQLE
jgi:hypothetical protein